MIATDTQDGIARIALTADTGRPILLDGDRLQAFATALEAALADDAVSGILLTSDGEHFAAGADIGMLQAWAASGTPEAALAGITAFQKLLRWMETGGKPVACALNGSALGGGLELALACHWRVAADRPGVSFGLPEVTLGLLPGGGGTQRLPRLIGLARALPLLLRGTRLNPAQAQKAGIVHALARGGDVEKAARDWLKSGPEPIAPWDRKGFAPPGGGIWSPAGVMAMSAANARVQAETAAAWPAPRAILSAVYEGLQIPIDRAFELEARYFAGLAAGPVSRAQIRIAHAGPRDLARQQGIGAAPEGPVGVVGAGFMGGGIAAALAGAGLDVVLIDQTRKIALGARQKIEATLSALAEAGKLPAEAARATAARLTAGEGLADLANCRLVIEAVDEDLALKRTLLPRIEAAMAPDAILASNSSALPMALLSAGLARPAQFVGLHFFAPVHAMRLLEIIPGPASDDATRATALGLARRLGKVAILAGDGPGFYTTRLFAAYVREGLLLLAEAVSPALAEMAARRAGMAMGPLAAADLVGLELVRKADAGLPPEPAIAPVLHAMCDRVTRPGRAVGKGFYDYPADAAPHLWHGLSDMIVPRPDQPALAEVADRLRFAPALEAARCLEEGRVADALSADLAAVLGLGLCRLEGGPLALIDQLGAAAFAARAAELEAAHGPRFAPPPGLLALARSDGRYNP